MSQQVSKPASRARGASVRRVREALREAGLTGEVMELDSSTRTAAEAARAVECEVRQIVKSLVFRAARSDRALLVVASGANRVDESRLEALAGEPVAKADADFVRARTGYAIGGVPPLAHATALDTWIDADLLGCDELWAAAGSPFAVFRLTPEDLQRMTAGTVAEVCRPAGQRRRPARATHESRMIELVLLRHGESTWNRENRFTGWTDVDLTEKGVAEARAAGRALRAAGIAPDVAYTSLLKRAIRTLWLVLDELDRMWIPVHRDWRLNERHYGALQGLDKSETAAKYGEEQVRIWRRSYDVPPPPLDPSDERFPGHDSRYAGLDSAALPRTECLADTVARMMPYWHEAIVPSLRAGRRAIIAAHGNSLRALVKYLDGVSEDEILGVNIPTGVPLLYELDEDLRPLDRRYLGEEEAVAAAMRAVANQGKAAG